MTAAASFARVSDRLSKLIPRLASDQGGEVVATAAAIARTLNEAGLTFHDLAERIRAETLDDAVAGLAPAPKPWTGGAPAWRAPPPRPPIRRKPSNL